MRPVRQQLTAVLSALAVLGLPLLPKEHVHVARTPDGHHAELIHRHFEPHERSGAGTAFDHEDDDHDVQWLTVSYTSPRPMPQVRVEAHRLEYGPWVAPPALISHRTVPPLFASVHDPPWSPASGPRAPPAFLL